MTFADEHQLVTVFGTAFGGLETWSFGVRFGGSGSTVTQALADALVAPTVTLWNDPTLFMPNSHSLTGVKVAPIGIDGKYPPGQIAYIGTIAPDTGPTSTNLHPAQVATVVTFLSTPTPRGRASRGRIYLPPAASTVNPTTGQNGMAASLAAAVRTWLNALNGLAVLGNASIMSELGTGLSTPITHVRADSLYDTQRRRRRQLTSPTTTVAL